MVYAVCLQKSLRKQSDTPSVSQIIVWLMENSMQMDTKSSKLNMHPLVAAVEKQEKSTDDLILVSEWIKSIIPMCEIHSFNQSISAANADE